MRKQLENLWGPSPVETNARSKYFISFTDDHTRRSTRLGSTLSSVQRSNVCAPIAVVNSVHDTPEHNGVAERLNRTLVERVRAMLHASGLPKSLWGEAMMHAVWLKNRSSTRALDGKTPYEMLYNKKPDLSGIPVWGCRVKVHSTDGSKLDMRAKRYEACRGRTECPLCLTQCPCANRCTDRGGAGVISEHPTIPYRSFRPTVRSTSGPASFWSSPGRVGYRPPRRHYGLWKPCSRARDAGR